MVYAECLNNITYKRLIARIVAKIPKVNIAANLDLIYRLFYQQNFVCKNTLNGKLKLHI